MSIADAQTRRQRIKQLLRDRPSARATAISEALDDVGVQLSPAQVVDEIAEVNESLPTDETLYVAPAECRDCGFDDWDHLLNIPSRCPESNCRSEWIEEPEFTIK